MALDNKRSNIKLFEIKNLSALLDVESKFREMETSTEFMPWAKNTPYQEIAESIILDKYGSWETPLYFTYTTHKTNMGIQNICHMANDYLTQMNFSQPIDILSISACIKSGKIVLKTLVRSYAGTFDFLGFFDFVGDDIVEDIVPEKNNLSGELVIPEEIKNFKYTEEQIKEHEKNIEEQKAHLQQASFEKPFLNSLTKYVPQKLPTPEDSMDLVYDLLTSDKKIELNGTYENFMQVFRELMNYISGVEYYNFINVVRGEKTESYFMTFIEDYIKANYVDKGRIHKEDVPPLLKKIHRALFQFYVIQDLIDDPNVTDIKITAPDSIRARVNGKAYISNITFIDKDDYLRFINGIAEKNHISLKVPEQTFTDTRDENYILRITISASYVNSVDWPYIHFRKVSRSKLLGKDLINVGMFPEIVKDYLLDCGKSKSVVFAGPPGSGKTVALNWFLEEAYEQSAEILVIQESDELFVKRKGVMLQHVVKYTKDNELPIDLEELGKLALVAGANVFVIGEAKGAEICSAITLGNSGCRTAMTIHSSSSTDTINKMADLAMRGYAQDYIQAKRMLTTFNIIVYLEDFQVKEISEIIGFDENIKDMKYRCIYRKEEQGRK